MQHNCQSNYASALSALSLRHQLKDTPVKVFEIVPPIVDTELDHGRRDKMGIDRGIKASEVADVSVKGIEDNTYEIGIGMTVRSLNASRKDLDEAFRNMNNR